MWQSLVGPILGALFGTVGGFFSSYLREKFNNKRLRASTLRRVIFEMEYISNRIESETEADDSILMLFNYRVDDHLDESSEEIKIIGEARKIAQKYKDGKFLSGGIMYSKRSQAITSLRNLASRLSALVQ